EDYNYMMKFTEAMYKETIRRTWGKKPLEIRGEKVDWMKKWGKVDYYDAFEKGTGIDLRTATEDILRGKARELGVRPEPHAGKGRLIDLIYKKAVRPKLLEPCFLVDPPVEIEPLAKRL